jgi:outer membrane receptor protein involved in Fe transport
VFNLTGVRTLDVAGLSSPLNIAVGTEVRREGYEAVRRRTGFLPLRRQVLANGTPAAPGAQVFPGFRPANEIDTHRTAVGAFVDLEANITPQLLASVAVRAEHYSDFGNSLAGKLAGRYDFSKAFALRGSCRTASARRRRSSRTSPRPRPTSSTACRSRSRPSNRPTRSPWPSAPSRSTPKNRSTCRSAACCASTASA